MGGKISEKYKQKKKLNRREWLQCLVNIAVMKYVTSGVTDDVSTAVQALLANDLAPNLDPTLATPPSDTRDAICYNEPVANVLERHEAALRLIYARTCELAGVTVSGGMSNKLVSYANWKDFLKIFGLVDVRCTHRLPHALCMPRLPHTYASRAPHA